MPQFKLMLTSEITMIVISDVMSDILNELVTDNKGRYHLICLC